MNSINDALLQEEIEAMQNKYPRIKKRAKNKKNFLQHKHWKAVLREEWKLRKVCWNEPKVEIDKPYQRGKDRYFKISDKLKNKLHYDKICQALECVNCYQYCRRGDFMHRQKKKRFQKKHKVNEISLTEICAKKIPEELLFCFIIHTGKPVGDYKEVWKLRRDRYSRELTFRYLEFCEQVVAPHIVPHKPVLFPELESEIDRLDRYIERNQLWDKMSRRNWTDGSSWNRQRKLLKYHNHLIDESLLEHASNQPTRKGMENPMPFLCPKSTHIITPYHFYTYSLNFTLSHNCFGKSAIATILVACQPQH